MQIDIKNLIMMFGNSIIYLWTHSVIQKLNLMASQDPLYKRAHSVLILRDFVPFSRQLFSIFQAATN